MPLPKTLLGHITSVLRQTLNLAAAQLAWIGVPGGWQLAIPRAKVLRALLGDQVPHGVRFREFHAHGARLAL